MSSKKPSDEKVSNVPPFGLRMLPAMKDRISQAAAENGRSMNAEIVKRLQDSLDFDDHRNYAPTAQSDELERLAEANGHYTAKGRQSGLNPIDMILVELKKLQMKVSSIRVDANGETSFVTESMTSDDAESDNQPFPDPTDEEILKKMADRLGYALTPKK